jgi:hypothetical protein
MRQARAFFFVCLGLLCIVAAYHLGARSAGAQSFGGGFAALVHHSPGDSNPLAIKSDGTAYSLPAGAWVPIDPVPLVPGTTVVAGNDEAQVLGSDGTLYQRGFSGIPGAAYWYVRAASPDGATPAEGTTWGQLKAKYATPAPEAAQVTR